MNKNKKITISVMTVIISALIAIIVVQKFSLKNPVFLMNCREVPVSEGYGNRYMVENINLKYITNVHDTRKIRDVTFREIPNSKFLISYAEPYPDSYKDISGMYKMNSVSLTCCDFKDISDEEEKVITKADVEFYDGTILEVDLGKIIFYKQEMESDKINKFSGSTSSDGISSNCYKVNEDLRIEKIGSPLYHEMEGVFKFNIISDAYDEEKKEVCEQKENIKKDTYITMTSEYINQDILKKYTIYDIRPKINFVNNENLRYSVRYCSASNISNNRNSASEIYMYLKARGEL